MPKGSSGAGPTAASGSCGSSRRSPSTIDAGHEERGAELVAKAEDGCLVTVSLDLPVATTDRDPAPRRRRLAMPAAIASERQSRRRCRRSRPGALTADALLEPWFASLRTAWGTSGSSTPTRTSAAPIPTARASAPPSCAAALGIVDARAVVFPLAEPGSYRAANDRMLAAAELAHGRLVPFCRVDPRRGGLREAERAVGLGAAGIKLHPRAERFGLADPEVGEIMAFADERRLPVIVHAGRGIPSLGRDALDARARLPARPAHPRARRDRRSGLDLARGGGPAQPVLRHRLVEHGRPAGAVRADPARPDPVRLRHAIRAHGRRRRGRAARRARRGPEPPSRSRSVAGGQLERLLAGAEPRDVGPAPMTTAPGPGPLLERVHTLLVAAAGAVDRRLSGGRVPRAGAPGLRASRPDHPDAAAAASVARAARPPRRLHCDRSAPARSARAGHAHDLRRGRGRARSPSGARR